MDAITERNSDHQVVEPWYDALRIKAENVTREGHLPVTFMELYRAVDIVEIKDQNPYNADRIRNVMTALGYYHQRQKRVNGERLSGWWPSMASTRKE